jgi:RES domain-containing protein
VGPADGLDFPPSRFLSWRNRFDHPDKVFRTLYCAEQRQTAFREVLADFRPNAKARAEYRRLHGEELPALRSKDRTVTQVMTRFLADRGAAGILYGSNLDDRPCAALFEGRSLLVPVPGSKPELLSTSHPDLVAVCNEFGLLLAD